MRPRWPWLLSYHGETIPIVGLRGASDRVSFEGLEMCWGLLPAAPGRRSPGARWVIRRLPRRGVHVPAHADYRFRWMPSTRSEPCRPPVPISCRLRFRGYRNRWTTSFGVNGRHARNTWMISSEYAASRPQLVESGVWSGRVPITGTRPHEFLYVQKATLRRDQHVRTSVVEY